MRQSTLFSGKQNKAEVPLPSFSTVATTGAGPDLVCAWRKAQVREKEVWKQVPVQSCKTKPSLPSPYPSSFTE